MKCNLKPVVSAWIPLSNYLPKWQLLTILMCCAFSCVVHAQFWIDPSKPVSPPVKAGYNLIFSDEFDSFNGSIWDISTPGNDGPNYGDAGFCEDLNVRNAPKNPGNVMPAVQSGGLSYLPLRVKEGEDMNACSHSSAEIKTFQNVNPSPNYRDWKIYPNSYVEVRLKAPNCPGVGGSAWLYGPDQSNYNEIDFFEMYGDKPNGFQTNFHYGPDGRRKMDPDEVTLADLNGNAINIGDHFLTYGVNLDPTGRVDIYVNDTWVSWKKLYQNQCGLFDYNKRLQPYNLRISTGSTTLSGGDVTDCNQLPVYMEIDYVRVYQKIGTKAVRYHPNTTGNLNFCNNDSGKNFAILYYPGAQYTWSGQPSFININNPDTDPDRQGDDNWRYYWVSLGSGAIPGVYHLTLTITFPGGYTEILPLEVSINNGTPSAPGPIYFTNSPKETSAYVIKQPGTKGYQWKIDNGPWIYADNNADPGKWNICPKALIPKPGNNIRTICVRSVNACGVSTIEKCRTISLDDPCEGCLQRPPTPTDIELELISEDSCNYTLRVSQSEFATEYLWSYDSSEWLRVKKNEVSNYNRFGNFQCNSEPFQIYVRAQNENLITNTFTKQITIPSSGFNLDCYDVFLRQDTDKQFTTTAPQIEIEIKTILVLNMLGQIVRSTDHLIEPDSFILQGLTPGIYFLQYLGENKKCIKSRKVAFIAN